MSTVKYTSKVYVNKILSKKNTHRRAYYILQLTTYRHDNHNNVPVPHCDLHHDIQAREAHDEVKERVTINHRALLIHDDSLSTDLLCKQIKILNAVCESHWKNYIHNIM